MEERKVIELPEKSSVELTDQFIIEDEDGTKLGDVSSLKKLLIGNLMFDTVEDMKSASLKEGEVCFTLGYYSINDGGAAKYKIEYAPELVEDRCNTHYLYTSDTLRAVFISDGSVTPEQFGAHGDGIRDDYKAIKACIDSGYNIEFIKSHKYKVETPIPVSSGLYLDFNGSTLVPYYCDAIQKIYTSGEDELQNVDIKNVIIDANNGSNGINIQHPIYNLNIDNVSIINNKLCGIRLADTEKCSIRNSKIESPNTVTSSVGIGIDGAVKKSTDVTVSNTLFKNCSPAILVYTNGVNVLKVDDCTADRSGITKNNSASFIKLYGGYCQVSVSNARMINLQEAFVISSDTEFKLLGFTLCKNCDTLIDNLNTNSFISLDSNIDMIVDEVPAVKTKVIKRLYGTLGIVSNRINYNTNAYVPIGSTDTDYSGTLCDSKDPKSYNKESSTGSNTLVISDFRNKFIDIQNTSDIDTITGGINGQRIFIVSSNNRSILRTSNILLKTNSIQLDSISGIELKKINNKWHQISSADLPEITVETPDNLVVDSLQIGNVVLNYDQNNNDLSIYKLS